MFLKGNFVLLIFGFSWDFFGNSEKVYYNS